MLTWRLPQAANLTLLPDGSITTISLFKGRMMSFNGRCQSLRRQRPTATCAREGCAVVILKRLSDALADHDAVLAVIQRHGASTRTAVPTA
jgi:acyl transferase domain-containing protein